MQSSGQHPCFNRAPAPYLPMARKPRRLLKRKHGAGCIHHPEHRVTSMSLAQGLHPEWGGTGTARDRAVSWELGAHRGSIESKERNDTNQSAHGPSVTRQGMTKAGEGSRLSQDQRIRQRRCFRSLLFVDDESKGRVCRPADVDDAQIGMKGRQAECRRLRQTDALEMGIGSRECRGRQLRLCKRSGEGGVKGEDKEGKTGEEREGRCLWMYVGKKRKAEKSVGSRSAANQMRRGGGERLIQRRMALKREESGEG